MGIGPQSPESEANMKKRVAAELRKLGYLAIYTESGGLSSGLPDLLVVGRSWMGFIEFKAATGRLRANQRLMIQALLVRGFPTIVAHCAGLNDYFLERIEATLGARHVTADCCTWDGSAYDLLEGLQVLSKELKQG